MSLTRTAVFITALVWNFEAFGQPTNHSIIFYPIYYSDGTTLALGLDLHFCAYLSQNPWHLVDETTHDNAVWDGGILVDLLSFFPDPWDIGDTVVVHIVGDGSNYSGPEAARHDVIVETEHPQYVLDFEGLGKTPSLPLTFVPLVYSNGHTPILPGDLHFDAFIATRPGEVLTETSAMNSVYETPYGVTILIDCSGFPTPWQYGEVLTVQVTGDGTNYTGPESFEINQLLRPLTLNWFFSIPPCASVR